MTKYLRQFSFKSINYIRVTRTCNSTDTEGQWMADGTDSQKTKHYALRPLLFKLAELANA